MPVFKKDVTDADLDAVAVQSTVETPKLKTLAQIEDNRKVAAYQTKLNKQGANLEVDGMWGEKTAAASRALFKKPTSTSKKSGGSKTATQKFVASRTSTSKTPAAKEVDTSAATAYFADKKKGVDKPFNNVPSDTPSAVVAPPVFKKTSINEQITKQVGQKNAAFDENRQKALDTIDKTSTAGPWGKAIQKAFVPKRFEGYKAPFAPEDAKANIREANGKLFTKEKKRQVKAQAVKDRNNVLFTREMGRQVRGADRKASAIQAFKKDATEAINRDAAKLNQSGPIRSTFKKKSGRPMAL